MSKTIAEMESDSYTRANNEPICVEDSDYGDSYVKVYNEMHNSTYYVKIDRDAEWVVDCDCPHHRFRGVVCKHMMKVAQQLNYRC